MTQQSRLEQFRAYRARMNQRIGEIGHREINRFFALDSATYRDGALDARTKELLGLSPRSSCGATIVSITTSTAASRSAGQMRNSTMQCRSR
jgi:hypothetical protein